jgi:hypothetical protein
MQVPKTNPVRRNARVGPLLLPASGRSGPTPRWPLPGRVDPFELAAWTQLWTTPQAVAWENLGWTRTVARYCRVMVAAERPDATGTLLSQATMMEDRLGLTPRAMRMLLWQIAPDEVTEKRSERTEDVRSRLRAVETG